MGASSIDFGFIGCFERAKRQLVLVRREKRSMVDNDIMIWGILSLEGFGEEQVIKNPIKESNGDKRQKIILNKNSEVGGI